MNKQRLCITIICLIFLFSGCAFDLVHVKMIPVEIEPASSSKTTFVLEKEVDVSLDTGYSRKLKQGTKWDYVGTLSQGDVYRTRDQILTVEGSNIFEAYIVVSSKKLVGFYVPVEKAYSPLKKPCDLYIKEKSVMTTHIK